MTFGELANADIFFFITSVAVILVTTLLIVVLVYVAEILHDIRHISKTARKESDHFTESIHALLADVARGGKKVKAFIVSLFATKKKR
jgi:formate-dependent nitrite reductase membrane component NrfD